MELTWLFTVLGLILRLAAIWAFDFPAARNSRTSFSRGVRRQGLALSTLRPEVTSCEAFAGPSPSGGTVMIDFAGSAEPASDGARDMKGSCGAITSTKPRPEELQREPTFGLVLWSIIWGQ